MTDGLIPRVRGLARLTRFILILSVLVPAGLLFVRLTGAHPRVQIPETDGRSSSNQAANLGAGSLASGPAKLPLDSPQDTAKSNHWKDIYARLPLSFEANEGQSAPQVKYLSRGAGYAMFLTDHEALLELAGGSSKKPGLGPQAQNPSPGVVHLELVGSSATPLIEGLEPLPGKSNYFIGNDAAKWRTGIANYARVRYRSLYSGIDLVYYGNQQQLEYDFVVSPGVDPRAIRLRVRGAESARVDAQGNLVLEAGGRQVMFRQPVIYQGSGARRRTVQGGYLLAAGRSAHAHSGRDENVHDVRFQIGAYDRTQPLVIDPTVALAYSSYLGGAADDIAYGLAVDSSGNAYLAGQTYSSNFPVKDPLTNPNESTCTKCSESAGLSDVFVAKINSTGSAEVYATYLGGTSVDGGTAIAVDSSGDAYVTGDTSSTDFPTTSGVVQTTGNVFGDAFVAELNPASSALVFSSYLGGSGTNNAYAIALDSSNYVYVAGTTNSTNFPVANAYQSTLKANATSNVFVSELQSAGTKLAYSTYLGGSGQDEAYAIAVSAPNVYVAGETTSNNFPTASAYQSSYGGQGDAFISKLAFSGSAITLGYSTYLGGTSADIAYGLALDSSGNAYVTGSTQSSNFPTQNAFQTKLTGGSTQAAFVAKLNGSTLVYSTYLGGGSTNGDTGYAVAVDKTGVAHVVGSTNSTSFPTLNPIQSANNGKTNAFLALLNPQGCGLEFSTYLGGSTTDAARGVATDSAGDTYLAGYTGSNNFPTQAPFQSQTGGNNDAFVAKVPAVSGGVPSVCFSPSSLTFSAEASTTTSSATSVTLTNNGGAALDVTSIAASGPFAETNTCGTSVAAGQNCTISVTFSPTQAGQLSGSVTVTDSAGGATSATQTIGLQGIGTDFSLAMTPATASVTAGQSETFMLTLTASQDFTDAVTLSCNGTPPAGTCTISPTSITPTTASNYTATVTVSTTAHSLAPPGSGNRTPPLTWLVVLLSIGLLAGAAWARRAGARRLPWRFATIIAFALLVFAWFGCGVSNGPATFTPAGQYNIAVTGTDGSLNHVIHSVLTVN